ncbi:Conserved oligomeric Golgi complex subunit 4 [Trichinella pseudospiralis]|uniref:Conserved oligomeric Golgi complex subunit 4 n=2 Tax=Trichinella pseudospiralis TaxID=6337 RepID=A0A0V1J9N8_TRIPS|nr:Conserved oligomeric Golgi complex subunit 4 [Trichinella pseudospiralis]KRZ38116.1 Conserved oligomeric Golgi complex subunit 4 [Trichinella pseudospiralis]
MLSELIISFTLLVNAGAVLNFKYRAAEDNFSVEEGYRNFGQSAMAFLAALRQLRIFIAIWNMFVIFLMFVVHAIFCLIDFFADFFPAETMLPFDFANQLEECRVELGRLKGDAVTLDNEISAILMASSKQAHELAHGQLSRVEAEIAVAESDFRQLANVFSSSWTLANGIGARVRQLDTAKGRVVDCMQLVDDALDLRLCVDGVRSALAVEQFEQAAEHVHRFFGVDAAVRQLSSREGVEDPTALMLDAKARLLEILLDKFEQADRQDDAASMERFFKLFPLIGEHQLGLTTFATQLTRRLADSVELHLNSTSGSAVDTGQPYVDALRLLLDRLVQVIETQQPIVDACYGPGKLFILWRLLQAQCDMETSRILDKFFEHRQFAKKLSLAEKCLKQSALSTSNRTAVDPLDLDALLSEMTLIQTCVQLYFKFIRRKVSIGIGKMPEETATQKEEKQRLMQKLQAHLCSCALNCRMQEMLGQYVAIEEYYMRESILKAIRLECRESGLLLSSVVDDCFFIISKSARRALATSDVDCICAMLNHACALLETHHLAHLKSRLKFGYPSSAGGLAEVYSTAAIAYATSVVHQGKVSGGGGIGIGSSGAGGGGGGGLGIGDSTDKLREDYLTALNDCGVSVECVEKLKSRLKDDFRNVLLQLNDVDQQKLDSCLAQLDETASKFHSSLSDAIEQLVRTSFKPRLRLAVDCFFNDTHAPSELEFVELESRCLFVENVIGCLQLLLEDLRQSLGERPLAMVHASTATLTADLLEKVTLKGTYNRLGGLLLDKQIRQLANYWTQFAGWSARQRFSRLDQIVSLLNVDSVTDAQNYCQSDSVTWLLNLAEIRQVLALRIDLPGNEIRKIQVVQT